MFTWHHEETDSIFPSIWRAAGHEINASEGTGTWYLFIMVNELQIRALKLGYDPSSPSGQGKSREL